jgi:hypothetical protein
MYENVMPGAYRSPTEAYYSQGCGEEDKQRHLLTFETLSSTCPPYPEEERHAAAKFKSARYDFEGSPRERLAPPVVVENKLQEHQYVKQGSWELTLAFLMMHTLLGKHGEEVILSLSSCCQPLLPGSLGFEV